MGKERVKMNNMKTLYEDEAIQKKNRNRIQYQDSVKTSYFNLIDLFGLPSLGKSDKVLCEWVLENNLGDVVAIYDWKSSTNDPEYVTEWNFGANGDTYSNVFINQIKEKIEKKIDEKNLVC